MGTLINRQIRLMAYLLILMFCSACGNTEAPFTTEDTQESSRAGDEVPGNEKIDAVPQNQLTYSNLDSELSMNEVRDILLDCWDENTAWLYTDGDILFGREDVEGGNTLQSNAANRKCCRPFRKNGMSRKFPSKTVRFL